MKKIILSICALAILSLLNFSCKKDDAQTSKKDGQVEFGFSLKAPSHSGAQKSSMKAAAEPAAVIVSIKRGNGNAAYSMERVELYNMNGYYISKPLSLLPGNYTLEQFLVVDAADSVIYASPVQGSPKAYLVSNPLPIPFTVGKDVVTKVVPEVLSTAGSTPEDFGYSTFSFEVVETFDFLIGVFVYNESIQNFELTTANLSIAASGKTVFSDTLAAITSKVTVNDGYSSYFLTVTKDGYKTWTDTLTAAELKLHFRSEDKGPLEVVLEKGAAYTLIKYGRLYNWYAVIDVRNIAADGWHVPSKTETDNMIKYLDPDCFIIGLNTRSTSLAFYKIAEKNTEFWSFINLDLVTNQEKFNLRGSGIRGGTGEYTSLNLYSRIHTTDIWFSSPYTLYSGATTNYNVSSGAVQFASNFKTEGRSVRLIKNATTLANGQSRIYIGNDGKIYRTICIGDQEWVADNLAETKYRNGDPIPEVTDNTEWASLTTGAWCAYDNDYSNI